MPVSLSRFQTNTDAVSNGAWVTVTVGEETFEILTRGYSPKFRNALAFHQAAAVRELNRGLDVGQVAFDVGSLPPVQSDECWAKALAEHCILDVRGLTHPDQRPLTGDEFRAMLQSPEEWGDLLRLAIGAASSVTNARKTETDNAVKNFGPASHGS